MNASAAADNAMNMHKSPSFMLTDCPVRAKQSLTGKLGGEKAGSVGVNGTLQRTEPVYQR